VITLISREFHLKQQKFPRLSLSKLTHEQILALVLEIVQLWSKQELRPQTVSMLLANFPELITLIEKILLREKASAQTALLFDSDEKRDRAYKQLLKKIRMNLTEFDELLVEAAESLTSVMEKFSTDITKMSYKEQSVRMRLALDEFRTESNISAITTLGLIPDLDRADLFNSEFDTLYNESITIEASDEELPLLRSVRREMEHKLRLLLDNTAYLNSEDNTVVSDTLFSQIEGEIVKYSATLKMRETRAETAE